MYGWVVYSYTWRERELLEDVSTPHRMVRVLVSGHHLVFMAAVRSWMGGCGAIHTESGEAKCKIAMYRLRT